MRRYQYTYIPLFSFVLNNTSDASKIPPRKLSNIVITLSATSTFEQVFCCTHCKVLIMSVTIIANTNTQYIKQRSVVFVLCLVKSTTFMLNIETTIATTSTTSNPILKLGESLPNPKSSKILTAKKGMGTTSPINTKNIFGYRS